MRPSYLSVSCLPTWARLNGIILKDVTVERNGENKGYGLTATTVLESTGEDSSQTLLKIPKDIILCAENITEHSKVDKHFRELLEVAGGKVIILPIIHVHKTANDSLVLTRRHNAFFIDASH